MAVVTKSERLSLRLTPAQDVVLRTAAGARGESTSGYVLRHAVEAAEMDSPTGGCSWLTTLLGTSNRC